MRWLMLLSVLAVLLFTPTCDQIWDECSIFDDSACDDGNPCTEDSCEQLFNPGGAAERRDSWCDSQWRYYCEYTEVDDGTPCEVDEQTGICEAGACRLEEEAVDGGV